MGALLDQYKSSPLFQELNSRLGDLVTEPTATGQDRKVALESLDAEKQQRFGPTEQDWPDQEAFEQAVAGTKQKRKLDAMVKQRQGTFLQVQQARETEQALNPPGPSLFEQSSNLMKRLFGDETALSQERSPIPITPEPIERDLVRGTTPTLAPKVPMPRPQQSSVQTPPELDPIIDRYAQEHNVPANLVRAVIRQESNFDPRAVSKMGAKGLMQLMDATASDLGVSDPFDPEANIRGGTQYLAQLLKRYGGDRERALAAYNFGMGNVESGMPLPKETKQYVQNVLRFAGDDRFARSPKIIQPSAQVEEASILPTDIFGDPRSKLGQLGTEIIGKTDEGRPIVKNPDGTVSTERTITEQIDGKWVNIPTMYGGKEVSPDDAVRIYRQSGGKDPETGRLLPTFGSVESAVAAAEARSRDELGKYGDSSALLMPGLEGVGDKIQALQAKPASMGESMPLPEGTSPQVARMLAPSDVSPTMPLDRYENGPIERSTARKLTGGLEAAGRGLVFGGPTKFFDWLDQKSHQLERATGLRYGGLFKDIADLSRERAENNPVDQNMVESIIERIAEAPSNDLPKIAAFTHLLGPVLGFAGLGMVEGAEKGTKEAIIEGLKGALTGGAFKGLEGLGLTQRLLAGGALGTAQTAAEGVTDPAELLASGVTMAALSAPGPIKGQTFGERLSGYKVKPQVSRGNPFDALGVDANTATLADVTSAFKEKANALQRTTFHATTDAERHASIDAFQRLTKQFREAESILGKQRTERPALDPGSVGEVQKLLPEPPLQAGSADALRKLKPLTPEQIVSDLPESLTTKKGEKPALIKKPVAPEDVYDPTVRPPVPTPSAEADAMAKAGTSAGRQRRAEPPKPETLLPEELSVRPMGQRQLIKKKPIEAPSGSVKPIAEPEADALAKIRLSNKAQAADVTPTATTELTAKEAKASIPEILTTKTGPPTITKKEVSVEQLQDLARQKQVGHILRALAQQMTGKPRLEVLSPSERKIVAKRLEEIPSNTEAKPEVQPVTQLDMSPDMLAGKPTQPIENDRKISDIISDTKPDISQSPLVPTDALPMEKAAVPRSELQPRDSAELYARAEKAEADMEIAGTERGGRYFQDTQGQGSTQDVIGLKSPTADWYKEATSGEKALSRKRVEVAIQKIKEDHGRDTGKDVQRVKELLLHDREFMDSPFAPKTDQDWQSLMDAAGVKGETASPAQKRPYIPSPDAITPEMREALEETNESIRETKPVSKETKHEFSTTQANLPAPLAKQVTDLAAKIPDKDLAEDGRETTPHVTVRYGLHGDDAAQVQRALKNEPPIRATLGKVSVFPATAERQSDVVKIAVDSPDLARLNQSLGKLPNTNEHGEYQPHITLAYVKPGLGEKYKQTLSNSLEGKEIQLNDLLFSDKQGKETPVPLRGKVSNKSENVSNPEPFSLTPDAISHPKAKSPQPEQQEIGVPAPTVGERPIIGREVTPEEAPLFSKAAKEKDAEQGTFLSREAGTRRRTGGITPESATLPSMATDRGPGSSEPAQTPPEPGRKEYGKFHWSNHVDLGDLPRMFNLTRREYIDNFKNIASPEKYVELQKKYPDAPIFLTVSGKLERYPMYSYKDASERVQALMQSGKITPAELPSIHLVDPFGKLLGHVSHDGRIWEGTHDRWNRNTALLHDPKSPLPEISSPNPSSPQHGGPVSSSLDAPARPTPRAKEITPPEAASRTSKSGYQSKGFSSDRDLKEPPAPEPAKGKEPGTATNEPTDFQAKASNRPVPSTPRIPVDPITGKEAKPISDIMIDVTKGVGQRIVTGKTPKGVGGYYSPKSSFTTIKYSGNLDTTAHELAHSLDDRFGIVADWAHDPTSPFDAELRPFAEHGSMETTGPRSSPQYVRAEGVAEWLRAYLVNPKAAEAAAPQFAQHALSKLPKETMKALKQFSDDIRTFAGATAHSKIMANVQWEAPETKLTDWITGDKAKNGPGFQLTWADTAKAELADRLHPFMKAIDYAREQRGIGEKPLPMNDPSLLARLYMGIHAKMDQIFEKGMIDARGNHVTEGGLSWLMEPLDKKALDAEMKEVASYMIAQRTMEKAEQLGKDRVSGIGAGIESDVSVAQQRIMDLNTQDPKKLKRIEEAASRYRDWADANLKYLLDKGRISVQQYDGIKANNDYYVAMQRILEVAPGEELVSVMPKSAGGAKLGTAKQPIQTFQGSTKTIKNPYSSLMDATYRAVREADRNDVMKQFRDLLMSDRKMYEGKQEDLASVGRLAQEGEKETIPIFVNGEKEIWQFNPEVYKALKAVDDTAMQLPKFLEVLTYPARIMRAGITQMPPFALRNIIRDAFQRVVLSNSGSKPFDSLKIYSKAEKEAFAKSGGDQAGYYYRDDADYQQAMKRTMNDLTNQGKTIVLDPAKLARGYSEILEGGERQGRLSEYRRAFDKAKTEMKLDDYNASLYAAGQARELLDFAIAGNTIRVINRFVPFTNAAIQGLRIAYNRAAANPVGVGARWFAWVAAPTLMAYMWNQSHGDIDEYRQLPAYQRDLFWNMKLGDDTWLAIPKPFEMGAMATTIERMTDSAMGNDQAFEGHWRSLANSLLPVDEQALFGPLQSVGSAIANYDFFRDKAIVPRHEENLDLSLRHTERASRLGQAIQRVIGVDARKIDFIVESQLGYLGKYATGVSDIGRKNRPGINASATGVLRPDPVDAALDVKWLHDKAVERGALGTKEWRHFQDIKNQYHKAEGREAREAMGVKVRAAAKKLRREWERHPPRPDAEKKLKRKRLLDGYPDPVLEMMGAQD